MKKRIIYLLAAAALLLTACGGGNTDLTPQELRETNNILTVLEDHSAMTYTVEAYDGAGGLLSESWGQYTAEDGRLRFDFTYAYAGGSEGAYSFEFGGDAPSAFYMVNDGYKYVTLCPKAEYPALLSSFWLAELQGYTETVESCELEDGAIVLTTSLTMENLGAYSTIRYHVDAKTGLLSYMEDTARDNSGNLLAVTKTTAVYDQPVEPSEDLAGLISGGGDLCELTVVINPGQDSEEVQRFQVAKDSFVSFSSMDACAMYGDEACTQPLEHIDVSGDSAAVYVVLGAQA